MSRIFSIFDQEAQMVKALRQGDPKAQRQLYDRYAPQMLGVCVRYVGDHMTAEDVLVGGFMKIFDKIAQFKSEGSFEGWMRRIMVNESLGHLRQQKRIQEVAILDEAWQIVDTTLADEALETEEMLQMINTLPTGYRTVFNLYAIEGYAHAEIAEKLGITESTSKSQLHRARAMLRQLVTDWENELKKKVEYEED